MDGRLGAPLGGEAADGAVHFLAEAQQVADDAAVQQGAVGVGVGQVGGQQVQLAKLVEDGLGGGKLLVAEGAEVEDGEGFSLADSYNAPPRLLQTGMPPIAVTLVYCLLHKEKA